MLVTQFDKFVNRSTQEILGSEIKQENLVPMLSTDIRNVGGVTGVKGNAEIYYRTGNVNLTPADLGALDSNNIYNGLDETSEGYALDARQGKALNETIGDKLDKNNVYNGLDETSEGYALDARQGKVLNDKIIPYYGVGITRTDLKVYVTRLYLNVAGGSTGLTILLSDITNNEISSTDDHFVLSMASCDSAADFFVSNGRPSLDTTKVIYKVLLIPSSGYEGYVNFVTYIK